MLIGGWRMAESLADAVGNTVDLRTVGEVKNWVRHVHLRRVGPGGEARDRSFAILE